MTTFKSGFVALIGRPNAGKSTLLNQLLGRKLAIVSDKPQTTRGTIRGVVGGDDWQAVLVDTPGVHKGRYKLDAKMMQSVDDTLSDCDLALYLVDVTQRFGPGEDYILRRFKERKNLPVFLLLNKIDLIEKPKLLPLIGLYSQKYDFAQVIPLSARKGDGCDILRALLPDYLPQGPRYYPEGMDSDVGEDFILAELVREQVLRSTEDEVPHSCAAVCQLIEERDDGTLYVEADIYVDTESQKGIVIGKNGAMLKKIGTAARYEMQRALGCPVFLQLRVRTRAKWRDDQRLLDNLLD